jgi:hypothetical protein
MSWPTGARGIASGARDIAGTLGDYQWVPEYCANILKLCQQLGNRRGQAQCLYSPAVIAEYLGQYVRRSPTPSRQ